MNYFDVLLKDRKNPYEIDLELFIRKMFEAKTDYTIELQKNEDEYGYDLTVFKYIINGMNWHKKHIANIEIEVSENWVNEYPNYWKDYSFLARKVFVYDYKNQIYTKEIKPLGDKTVYIIFNKSLNDSFCQSIRFISNLKMKKRFVTGDIRTDTVIVTDKFDKRIIRGVRNCLNFSYSFIKQQNY